MNGSVSARTLERMWVLTVSVTAVALLYLAKVVFLPLAFAILFAFLLAPLVSRLERIHLPRAMSALAVIVAFAALLGAAGWIFFTQLVGVANDLPIYRDNIEQKLLVIHQPTDSPFARAEQEVEGLSEQIGLAPSNAPVSRAGKASQKPLGTSPDHPIQVREVSRQTGRLDELGGMLGALTTAALSVVFTFFVLLQREDLRNRLIRLSGDRNLTMITQAMDDAGRRIGRYFRLQLLVNVFYGAIVLAVLWAEGLPHALLFGVLAVILRFVPYIGWPIAALLSTGLSLAVFQGWEKSLIIAGTFFCLEIITANYVEPHIYGKHTGLSSLAILVAAAFWTLLWGPIGLVLSVPLTVCLVVMGSHMPALEFLTVMLGDKPAIAPWMCYYQRLLARDEREAGDVLEKALKGSSLEAAYDSVLIPALSMSEVDRLHNDLEDSTVRYIRSVARESVEELGFREHRGYEDHEEEPQEIDSVAPGRTLNASQHLPRLRVMCVPVRDDADELATNMLAQVLDNGHAHAFPIAAHSVEELLEKASPQAPDIVFLSAIAPVGIARCHRLYRRLRVRSPQIRIMIGIWSFNEDAADAGSRISGNEEARVWTTLAEALAEVRGMSRAQIAPPSVSALPGQTAA